MQFIIDFYTSIADTLVKLNASDSPLVKPHDLTIWIFLSIAVMSIAIYVAGIALVIIVDYLTVKRNFKITLFNESLSEKFDLEANLSEKIM